jgi:hypothetical protein
MIGSKGAQNELLVKQLTCHYLCSVTVGYNRRLIYISEYVLDFDSTNDIYGLGLAGDVNRTFSYGKRAKRAALVAGRIST